jgi:hypothetical protein
MGVGVQRHAQAANSRVTDPVPIVQEDGWDPGPVWMGEENSPLMGFNPRTIQSVANRYTDLKEPRLHYFHVPFRI